MTNLSDAVKTNDCAKVKQAIANATSIDPKDKDVQDAFIIAVELGYTEIVALLISTNVDIINTQDKDVNTPLNIMRAANSMT